MPKIGKAQRTLVLTKVGTLATGVNVTLALLAACAMRVYWARCYAKTAPTGADIIVDVNKNGITIFTTQTNRPKITAGQQKGNKSAAPNIKTMVEGDVITLDIDQVGSTIAGADLTVEVHGGYI